MAFDYKVQPNTAEKGKWNTGYEKEAVIGEFDCENPSINTSTDDFWI